MPDDRVERRLPPLDGLRAVAVSMVIALHWLVRTPVGARWGVEWPRLHAVLDLGWCGVDLFFVLSGFLIGGILIDQRASPNLFPVFYLRRAARVLPVYWLVLAVAFILPTHRGPALVGDVPLPAYALFVQNAFTALGRNPGVALAPLWSLAIEEQFYVAGPLLACFGAPALVAALVGSCVLGSPLLRAFLAWRVHGLSPWDFTLCRLDGLALGVAGAWLVRAPHWRAWLVDGRALWSGVLTLLIAGTPLVAQARNIGDGQWLVVAGISYLSVAFLALIVHVVLFPDSRLARTLSVRGLTAIGRVSYFLYAFHMLVWCLTGRSGARHAEHVAIAAMTLALLAPVSWLLVERPLLGAARRHRYAPSTLRADAASAPGALDLQGRA